MFLSSTTGPQKAAVFSPGKGSVSMRNTSTAPSYLQSWRLPLAAGQAALTGGLISRKPTDSLVSVASRCLQSMKEPEQQKPRKLSLQPRFVPRAMVRFQQLLTNPCSSRLLPARRSRTRDTVSPRKQTPRGRKRWPTMIDAGCTLIIYVHSAS